MRNPIEAAARLNFALRLDKDTDVARPRDARTASSGAPNEVRVLLLGNGPAAGWGVTTQRAALTGALSRSLGDMLGGTPVDVDLVGDETMNMATALPWIGRRDLAVYAAVIVVIGTNDALRLVPVPKWSADLDRLLSALEDRLPDASRITVVGVQPVRTVAGFDTAFGLLGQRHATRLNEAAQLVAAAHDRADWTSMPAPEKDPGNRYASARTYQAWAEHLTGAVHPSLADAATSVSRAPAPADPMDALPDAARSLVDGSRPASSLYAIAETAKRQLKVDAAVITLMTDEQQFFAASTTMQPTSVPRELTYCDTVVANDAPLVVPNAKRDERFKDNAYVDLIHLPFYTGVPLHDADGVPIGTFCVMSALPKAADHVDLDALQALARQAELELQSRLAEPSADSEVLQGWGAIRAHA